MNDRNYDRRRDDDRWFSRNDNDRYDNSSRGNYGNQRGDRDWTERAGDEVRSWFGDDDAERRRRHDERERRDDRFTNESSYELGGYRSGTGLDGGYARARYDGSLGQYNEYNRGGYNATYNRGGSSEGAGASYNRPGSGSEGYYGQHDYRLGNSGYGDRYESGRSGGSWEHERNRDLDRERGWTGNRDWSGNREWAGNREWSGERNWDMSHDRGNDRGFFERAGDEVRSWFGDNDAERRRQHDSHYNDNEYSYRNTFRHDDDDRDRRRW